jgi:hypothetical protein
MRLRASFCALVMIATFMPLSLLAASDKPMKRRGGLRPADKALLSAPIPLELNIDNLAPRPANLCSAVVNKLQSLKVMRDVDFNHPIQGMIMLSSRIHENRLTFPPQVINSRAYSNAEISYMLAHGREVDHHIVSYRGLTRDVVLALYNFASEIQSRSAQKAFIKLADEGVEGATKNLDNHFHAVATSSHQAYVIFLGQNYKVPHIDSLEAEILDAVKELPVTFPVIFFLDSTFVTDRMGIKKFAQVATSLREKTGRAVNVLNPPENILALIKDLKLEVQLLLGEKQ